MKYCTDKNIIDLTKKMSYICGARITNITKDAKIIQTFSKRLGRRTVESTEVFTKHRFCSSCSDLPLFFNSNVFIMQERKQDDCTRGATQEPVTAEQIVRDILSIDSPENIREDLHELMNAFFLYHDSLSIEFKSRVFNTYSTFYNAVGDMAKINHNAPASALKNNGQASPLNISIERRMV